MRVMKHDALHMILMCFEAATWSSSEAESSRLEAQKNLRTKRLLHMSEMGDEDDAENGFMKSERDEMSNNRSMVSNGQEKPNQRRPSSTPHYHARRQNTRIYHGEM